MRNPTERFSDRVADYSRHRPTYPPGLVDHLVSHCDLGPASLVADIGSGTGIFTGLLLGHCARVWAVEPNPAMRAEAERTLSGRPGFVSVDGSAEATTLADHSVHVATMAQAFHWFRPAETRAEVHRILQPGGMAVIVTNRRVSATPFLAAYDALVASIPEYTMVAHTRVSRDQIHAFFGDPWEETVFPHAQTFDWDGLEGRFFSSSYVPPRGSPASLPLLDRLRTIFEIHARGGTVDFLYEGVLQYGRPV